MLTYLIHAVMLVTLVALSLFVLEHYVWRD